jgi:hypothetical protein
MDKETIRLIQVRLQHALEASHNGGHYVAHVMLRDMGDYLHSLSTLQRVLAEKVVKEMPATAEWW